MKPSFKDIVAAAKIINNQITRTPCSFSKTLSDLTGANVYLKFENLHFTASFKERGALVKLLELTPKERKAGVIAMSAGNHAQALAYHGRRLGVPVVIVMPKFTPNIKVEHTRAFGAKVILHGESVDQAGELAAELAQKNHLLLVHPFDDFHIIRGQGTVALEMLADFPELDQLIIPVGGGGLISGNAISAKAINPKIKIIGVEAKRCPSMYRLIKQKSLNCSTATIAEGIAVMHPGHLTRDIISRLVDDLVIVSENEIERAVLLLLEVEKTIVEGAGAAALAALVRHKDKFTHQKVGIILSGGNIDLTVLSSIIQRGLVRSGRKVRIQVVAPDDPGALSTITRIIAEAEANIIEVHHQRAFTTLSLKSAEVELILQTRGDAHVDHILASLESKGFKSTWIDRIDKSSSDKPKA